MAQELPMVHWRGRTYLRAQDDPLTCHSFADFERLLTLAADRSLPAATRLDALTAQLAYTAITDPAPDPDLVWDTEAEMAALRAEISRERATSDQSRRSARRRERAR